MADKFIPTNKKRYTDEQLTQALIKNHGNITKTARDLGYCPSAIYRRLEQCPEILDILELTRKIAIDKVEDILFEMCERGDMRAIKLFLEARAKDRGYGSQSINMYGKIEHKIDDDVLQLLEDKFKDRWIEADVTEVEDA